MSSARVSAAVRCHDDHLSPVFCFLDTADFACAIRVCRQWSRVGLLKSAWPTLNLEALCAGPAHRGISHVAWSGPRVEFILSERYSADDHVAVANRFISNPLWTKHASHVRVRATTDQENLGLQPSPAFLGLPRFTKMQSLALSDSLPAAEHTNAVFTALAPQLIALSLTPKWQTTRESVQPVHLLTNLRLLSLSAWCTAGLLAPLVQLETLHLIHRFTLSSDESKDLIVAIRRLSVEHQLRTLKIVDMYAEWEVDLLERPLPDGLAPAALTNVSLLQGRIDHTLLLLPSLTRMELGCSPFHSAGMDSASELPDCVSMSLRHLRIADENQFSRWPYRDLGAHMPLVHSLDTSQLINSLSFDLSLFGELRELTANCGRDGLSLSTLQTLSKLAHLTQLTVRVHPLYSVPVLTLADLKALSRSHTLRRLVCVLAEPPADRAHWNCKPTFALKIDEAERILDLEVHVRSHANSDCAVYGLQLIKAGAAPGVRMQWRQMDRACNEH